jgi:hypothetical protein
MNKANFSTTKPNAIMPILVLIQARNVLSLAIWSRLLPLFTGFLVPVVSSMEPAFLYYLRSLFTKIGWPKSIKPGPEGQVFPDYRGTVPLAKLQGLRYISHT